MVQLEAVSASNGKLTLGDTMQCTQPVRIKKNLDARKYPDGLEVPCGRCLACRIKKRQEWVLRLTHELSYYQQSSFVTLTYNDAYLPIGEMGIPTLRKADLQKCIKRIRKALPADYRIKYFACGEYGDLTQRPHYHLILMGLGLTDEHKQIVMRSWPFCDWDNEYIRRGSFGVAEADSVRYVAQYIDKKFSGDLAEEEYEEKGREPVFRLLSQGLGLRYAQQNADQIRQQERITLNGVNQSIPRYYINKLSINPEMLKDHAVESELDTVERIIGVRISRDDAYMRLDVKTVIQLESNIKASKTQHDKNLHAKNALKIKKL